MKTVAVSAAALALCPIKATLAADLNREEVAALMHWCDVQTESLWDGMSLQEILNVYRAAADYDTWEGWAEDDRPAAHAAWNRAVIDPGNKMQRAA